MKYSAKLETGSDGTCLGWVHELHGCAARAPRRAAIERALAARIRAFLGVLNAPAPGRIEIAVVEEIASEIATAEDTEALIGTDRAPLALEEWDRLEGWLAQSRRGLLEALASLPAGSLDRKPAGGSRTLRAEILHIAFVEVTYAAWTFDHDTPQGLAAFLAWTRGIAAARLRALAERQDATVTFADWAGAPRREPWTAAKAARRLVWHERLHLPSLRRES